MTQYASVRFEDPLGRQQGTRTCRAQRCLEGVHRVLRSVGQSVCEDIALTRFVHIVCSATLAPPKPSSQATLILSILAQLALVRGPHEQ
jgi:hypothetical protein